MKIIFTVGIIFLAIESYCQDINWITNPDTGSRYFLVNDLMTRDQAISFAEQNSAKLLKIDNEEELQWLIVNVFVSISPRLAHTGLELIEDEWLWFGSIDPLFENWMKHQPDGSARSETAMVIDREGFWHDIRADAQLQSIIEIENNESKDNLEDNIDFNDLVPFSISDFEIIDFMVPEGFIPPDPEFSDGNGLIIYLHPGQGVLLQANHSIEIPENEVAYLSASINCPTDSVEAALIAFESPIEGNFGFVNPIRSEIPVNEWGRMELVYPSRTGSIVPAMQFVLRDTAPEGLYTIYVDNLTIETYEEPALTDIRLQGDGTFDTTNRFLVGLNPNAFVALNEDPGFIELTDGLSEQGLRFQLEPDDQAANVALFSVAPDMPAMIHGSVRVRRESSEEGAVAFVITDSDQTVCYYIQVKDIPVNEFMELRIGGNFRIPDKITPPIGVFQLGGPGVSSSVTIDDLQLFVE